MIEFDKWQVRLANDIPIDVKKTVYSSAFYHPAESIDNRTTWSEQYIRARANDLTTVKYDRSSISISFNQQNFSINNLSAFDIPDGKVLVDATSLQVPELLHIFRLLASNERDFDVMYVQPTSYTERKSTATGMYTFELSDDGPGSEYLPPFVNFAFDSTLFVCLGYEGHRFGALINSESFSTPHVKGLLGIPPFSVGMEHKSLSANYEHILSLLSSPDSSISVCGANDPLKALNLIEQAHVAAKYERRQFSVAPIGTKPTAVAALIYAINTPQVALIYDFVQKKKGRTSGKDIVHLWSMKVT